MEWIVGFALVCAIFVLSGIGTSIWMTVLKDWDDRKKR
jgi:hypothetical protein